MKRILIIFATALLLLSACTQIHYVPIEELFPDPGEGKIQYVASSDSELRDILRKAHNGDEIFLNRLSIDPTSEDFTPYEINKDVEIGGFLKLSKEASARVITASRANTGTIVIFTVNDTAAAIINEFSVDIDDSIAPNIKAIVETDRGKITAESFTLNYSGSTSIIAINLGINANADSLAGNLQGLIVTIDENNENKTEIEEAVKENTGAEIAPSVWDGSKDISWYDPDITEYTIKNAKELAGLAELVAMNTDFSGKNITLTADIDLNNLEWSPIGSTTRDGTTTSNYFRGTFDGKNHKIKNIYINQTLDADNSVSGFFGVIADAEIKNLTIESGTITDNGDTAGGIIGAIIDETGGTSKITDCHNNASIYSKQASGGIVGRAYGSGTIIISSCTNSGTVSGGNKVGGITAINHSNANTSITNCHNTGSISGENDGIGGIIGYANANIKIEVATNTGEVKAGRFSGGIIGYTSGDEELTDTYILTEASNTAKISGTSSAGGIIGLAADFNITDVHNSGYVACTATAGGIAGSMTRVKISDSINTAAIHGEEFAGGIAGNLQGKNHVDSVSAGYAPITTGERIEEGNKGYAGRLFGSLANSPNRSDASYIIVDDNNNDSYEGLGTIGIIGPGTAWGGLIIEEGTYHGIPAVGGGPGQFEFISGAEWDGYEMNGSSVFRLTRNQATGETEVKSSSWYS